MQTKTNDLEFVTAGVWVRMGNRFPFEVGPDKTGKSLGVVRVGGHIETGETPSRIAPLMKPSPSASCL